MSTSPVIEPVYEYEVHNPHLDKFYPRLRCNTRLEAEALAHGLERSVGLNFFVEQVEIGKEPIPPMNSVVTAITVHEARKLMATHGQDVLVAVAWSAISDGVNIVTAGSDRKNSEHALELGNKIAAGLGLKMGEFIEDRREEHKT